MLLFLAAVLFVEAEEAVLFVLSEPSGVAFSVDGNRAEGRTPALLRVPAGLHRIDLRQAGYRQYTGSVMTRAAAPAVFDAPLVPDGVSVETRGRTGTGLPVYGGRMFRRLPDGEYAILALDSGTTIEPVFPGDSLLHAVNALIPVSFGALAAAIGLELASPGYALHDIPPLPVAAGVVSLALGGWKLSLELSKRSWIERYPGFRRSGGERWLDAESRYSAGEKSLTGGNLDDALPAFTEVLRTYPDSPLVPFALYNIARIHAVRGDSDLAETEFTALQMRFPHPAVYDRSCKNLADLLYRNGSYGESLDALSRMVYADPLYTKESVEKYAADILESWYRIDSGVLGRLTDAWRSLAEHYPDSPDAVVYRYGFAKALGEAGRKLEALDVLPSPDGAPEALKAQIIELTGRLSR